MQNAKEQADKFQPTQTRGENTTKITTRRNKIQNTAAKTQTLREAPQQDKTPNGEMNK